MFEVGMKVHVLGYGEKMRIRRLYGKYVELYHGTTVIHRTTDQIWE